MAGMHQWEIDLERSRDAARDRDRIKKLEAELASLRSELAELREKAWKYDELCK